MEIIGELVSGKFIERLNRFLVKVGVDGEVECFLPNPGRLEELLQPGAHVILKESYKSDRKTRYDLVGVYCGEILVSVDSRVPNKLILEALRRRDLEEFTGYNAVHPEFKYGNSKFDFLLMDGEKCLLEVKSCTLVKNNVAMFPDAPTDRGRRHVEELIYAKKDGYRTCVIFVVQRPDAERFSPNDKTDPKFGKTLRKAFQEGVEVYAYSSEFAGKNITLIGKIEVVL